jgi:phosphodiesterase/alkaline phosphatase D-like protein
VKIVRGPYIQSTTGESTRIAWWTNIPAASVVNYGVSNLSQQVSDPVLTQQHVMLIGNLTAGTTYRYQVVSGNATSATSTFITAALPGSTFSFATVGDYGGGSSRETQIATNIANGGTQFVQTLGDNVSRTAS